MKKVIILAIVLMVAGCAGTTGKDIGAAVSVAGDIIGSVVGFDVGMGVSAAIAAGSLVAPIAIEDALDNDGLTKNPTEKEDVGY